MTNQTNQTPADQTEAPEAETNELELLKNRARMMGIPFSNNISPAKLKQKIADKMAEDDASEEAGDTNGEDDGSEGDAEVESAPVPEKAPGRRLTAEQQIRVDSMANEMKLVRIRVACMNPQKANLPGEFFCTGNKFIGTVKKFVPFGEATENGYHVPYCIYKMMEERRFQHITTVKDPRTGQLSTRTRDMKEFSIEVLPPLTPEELQDLKIAQLAAGSIDNPSDDAILS